MGRMPVRTWDGSTEALAAVEVEDVAEVVGTAVARYLGVTAVHAEDMRELLRACAAPPVVRPAGAARALVELVARDGAVVHRFEFAEVVAEFPRVLRWRGRVYMAVAVVSTVARFVEVTEMEVGDDVGPRRFRTAADLAAHVADVSKRAVDIVDEVFDADGLASACVHVTLGNDATVMVEWCRSTGLFSDALFTDRTRRTLPESGSFESVADLFAAVWRFLGHE